MLFLTVKHYARREDFHYVECRDNAMNNEWLLVAASRMFPRLEAGLMSDGFSKNFIIPAKNK